MADKLGRCEAQHLNPVFRGTVHRQFKSCVNWHPLEHAPDVGPDFRLVSRLRRQEEVVAAVRARMEKR